MRSSLSALLLVTAVTLPAQAQTDAPAPARATAALEANPALSHSPEMLLVKFRAGAAPDVRASLRAAAQLETVHSYGLVPGLELVHARAGAAATVAALSASPAVEYAEPDYVVRATDLPNDAYISSQWAAANTGQAPNGDAGVPGADARLSGAWSISTGDPGVIIAVIDTGVQHTHPDLAPNIWTNPGEIPGNGLDDDRNGYIDDVRGWDFYDRDADPDDANGHGTHVAGIIGAAGNNAYGVAGVMWSCRIMPLRFVGPTGGYMSDAVAALQYAVSRGAKVSNNSWGAVGAYSQAMFDAINAARSSGHIFVAAAGNGDTDNIGDNNDLAPFYPASYTLDNVIAVAAVDNDDHRPVFSNFGAGSVDIAAPGVNIISTYPGGSFGYNNGTSTAAPHVAGVAGLLCSSNPTASYQTVRSRILETARPVPAFANLTATGGVLDAAAALTPAAPPPPTASVPAAPGTPTVVRISSAQLRITWADQSGNEDGFELQRERKEGKSWTGLYTIFTGANVGTATDSPGVGTFRYRVRAFNAAGVSAWSGWKQFKN
jgi:serine protease